MPNQLNLPKPILFAIIGAITGFIITQVTHYTSNSAVIMFLFGGTLIVINVLLVWQKQSNRITFINLALITSILGLLISWNISQGHHDSRSIVPLFIAALLQIGIIATTFTQAWKQQTPHYRYADLFENGWNNHFFFLFSGIFTGGCLLILLVGTTLFDSIGIAVSEIIWNDQITPIIISTLLAAGIGISREHETLIFKIRSVFFALFHVMAFLAAIIIVLFAITLPFSWQGLFNNKETSTILLSLVAVSILLLNSFVDLTGDEDNKTKLSTGASRLFSVQILLLPILSLLSVYAIILRIQQYGLMPNRLIALSIAILLTLYGLSYSYQLLKQKGVWQQGIANANALLALIWLVTLIALSSPLLDPVRLSVASQLGRLQNNQISVENFDFYALRHHLGNAGKNAFDTLRSWKQHPHYASIIQHLENKQPEPSPPKPVFITVLGETPQQFKQLKEDYYHHYHCNKEEPLCFATLKDMNRDNEKETLVIRFEKRNITVNIYQKKTTPSGWVWKRKISLNRDDLSNQQIQQAIETLKQNKLIMIPSLYSDLQLGDIKIRTINDH